MAEILNIKGNGYDVYDENNNWIERVPISCDDTMVIGTSDSDFIRNEGTNVEVYGGSGNDKIDNVGSNVLVQGDGGSDEIYNSGNNVTLWGNEGVDSIKNNGSYVVIGGGNPEVPDGRNVLESYGGTHVTIYGSADQDYIVGEGNSIVINAGYGNDTVYTDGNNMSSRREARVRHSTADSETINSTEARASIDLSTRSGRAPTLSSVSRRKM